MKRRWDRWRRWYHDIRKTVIDNAIVNRRVWKNSKLSTVYEMKAKKPKNQKGLEHWWEVESIPKEIKYKLWSSGVVAEW